MMTDFDEVFARYRDRLYGSVLRLLNNAHDAEDVVQETFLNAYKSRTSFKGQAQIYTWLYRIAINVVASLKRRRRSVSLCGVGPSDYSKPEDAVVQGDQIRRVNSALSRLSPEHRHVVILKDIEGIKYESIAVSLDLPLGTVRSRLHRARLELRELLQETDW